MSSASTTCKFDRFSASSRVDFDFRQHQIQNILLTSRKVEMGRKVRNLEEKWGWKVSDVKQ